MKDLTNKLSQMEKKMSGGDYKEKVPANVQAADAEKCESLRSEINESQKAIDGIKQLIWTQKKNCFTSYVGVRNERDRGARG